MTTGDCGMDKRPLAEERECAMWMRLSIHKNRRIGPLRMIRASSEVHCGDDFCKQTMRNQFTESGGLSMLRKLNEVVVDRLNVHCLDPRLLHGHRVAELHHSAFMVDRER